MGHPVTHLGRITSNLTKVWLDIVTSHGWKTSRVFLSWLFITSSSPKNPNSSCKFREKISPQNLQTYSDEGWIQYWTVGTLPNILGWMLMDYVSGRGIKPCESFNLVWKIIFTIWFFHGFCGEPVTTVMVTLRFSITKFCTLGSWVIKFWQPRNIPQWILWTTGPSTVFRDTTQHVYQWSDFVFFTVNVKSRPVSLTVSVESVIS